MAAAKEQSFGVLVFGKAVSTTWEFFGSTRRDLVLGTICVVAGFALYWHFRGLPVALDQLASVAAFTFGPVGFVMAVVFLWNLWIAPAALAYEATKVIAVPIIKGAPAKKEPPPIKWGVWKQMPQYTLLEFAAILAGTDPVSGSIPHEVAAYVRAMVLDIEAKKLPYIPAYGENYSGNRYLKRIDESTSITKADALKWADSKGFPCDHVR